MKPHVLSLTLLLGLWPATAQAQIHIGIELGLPRIPRMVVISPGIQVVEGYEGEVFRQGGWYWCRRSDGWYRSRSPQARFEWVEERRVPGGLSRMPAGRYHNWHRGDDRRGREDRGRNGDREDRGRHGDRGPGPR